MKKFRNILIVISVLLINVALVLNVHGAAKQSYTATLTGDSTVNKDTEFTLAFNATALAPISSGFAGYSGKINFDNTKIQFIGASNVVGGWAINTAKNSETKITFLGYDDMTPANTVYTDSKICNLKFKVLPTATGSTTITLTSLKGTTSAGESLIAADVSKTITITDASPSPSKSSDATLSSLTTSAGLNPSFSPTTESYSVAVGNDVTSIDVNAITNDPSAKVSVSGNSNLSVGKNNVIVQVTAEDGSKKTYTIVVTREASSSTPSTGTKTTTTPKSSNNNLKTITGIDGLQFDPNKTSYDVEVPFETTSLTVGASAQDSKSSVTINNGKLSGLKVGETNSVTISVKAEDGSIKVYTINVKRSQYKSETDLEKLIVNDKDIAKDGQDEYTITVPSGTSSIDVSAIPKSKDSTVTILGNTNLKTGNNKVLVQVKDKNGFIKTYILNVNRQGELSLFKFIDKYWYLFLIIPLIILLILLYLYNKNKKQLEEIDEEQEQNETKLERVYENYSPTNIDNKVYISYNSNNSIGYLDKDEDKLEKVARYLSDDTPEIERKVNFVKRGVDDFDREYEIKEKLRKK